MNIIITDGMEIVIWLLLAGTMMIGAGVGAVVASSVGLEKEE